MIDGAMLAHVANNVRLEHLLDDDEWVMEQKLDGKRLLVSILDREAKAYNRNGEPTDLPVPVAFAFDCKGFDGEWMLDGELMGGTYYVFDILTMKGKPVGQSQFRDRRFILEQLFNVFKADTVRLVPQWSGKTKRTAFTEAKATDREGVVFKNTLATHQPNKRSYDFLKYKFVDTIDVVVDELEADGKPQAIRIALYNNGKKVDAGGCKIPDWMVGKLNVNDVIECNYLYGTEDYKLYQPTWLKLRSDKTPTECSVDQLKFTCKEVMHEIN